MHDPAASPSPTTPLRDARLHFVRRTALWLLILGALGVGLVAVLHWLQPEARLLSKIMPPLFSLSLAALAYRQWRQPERLATTLWTAWTVSVIALATPAWVFTVLAWRGPPSLVDSLPPIGAAFLPLVLVMALFARARHAGWATVTAWLLIAAPVLAYFLFHGEELRSPRGLDLMLALGPISLFVPLLIPLLRGVELRFHALHQEGERLQALAERDVLIGLYNRRAGERFLATLIAHANDDAVLILFDIDHFKRINDRFGHPAGDTVLIEVGRRCAALLGRDDIFARWGGEEFLIVLPGAPRDAGRAVAERLRQAINAEAIADVGHVSASFGVTALRQTDTLAEVIQRADEALYRAKAEGRNRVVADFR